MGAFPVKTKDSTKTIDARDEEEILLEKMERKVDSTVDLNDLATLVPDWQESQLYNNAKNALTNILNTVNGKKVNLVSAMKSTIGIFCPYIRNLP